jgi:DMSO reductase anchor subunit
MIYAQLKTVPQWQSALTPVVYLGFALGSGWLLASALGSYQSPEPWGILLVGLAGARSGCGGLGRPGRGSRMQDRPRKLPPGLVSSARCGFSKSHTAATIT